MVRALTGFAFWEALIDDAFQNQTDQPTRFINRHAPGLGFQGVPGDRRPAGQARQGEGQDFRSRVHLSMAQARYRADKLVKPPQAFFDVMAWIGRRPGYSID